MLYPNKLLWLNSVSSLIARNFEAKGFTAVHTSTLIQIVALLLEANGGTNSGRQPTREREKVSYTVVVNFFDKILELNKLILTNQPSRLCFHPLFLHSDRPMCSPTP